MSVPIAPYFFDRWVDVEPRKGYVLKNGAPKDVKKDFDEWIRKIEEAETIKWD